MYTLSWGRDLASAILDALALLILAAAAYSSGAALAFPTVLYAEIVTLAQQGKAPTYDIEAAIWHSFWTLPPECSCSSAGRRGAEGRARRPRAPSPAV
ncbi:MAG: hypothetical protein KGJ98_08895 [Chloroflexota bacterium]|nr:hypothetical protein [Chloroflexota bacterium]